MPNGTFLSSLYVTCGRVKKPLTSNRINNVKKLGLHKSLMLLELDALYLFGKQKPIRAGIKGLMLKE